MTFRKLLHVLLLTCLCAPVTGLAQDWPGKPIRFIVPFPPGGSVDPLARLIGAKVGEALKQQVVVENRAGASGAIGTALAAKAPPDGYTWVFVFDTHAVNPSLNPALGFDTAKDLAPVMLIGTAPMAIATAANKPYKTFADVSAAAKRSDGVSIGSIGNGSLGHLAAILISQASGTKLIHVPYKGGGPLTTDAMGGQVDLAIASVAALSPHVRSGKLRAIAVTADQRSHTMPDVPTLAEQGVRSTPALAWWGMFAPAGTPKPILDRMHQEVQKALQLADVRKTLTETLGMDIVAASPDATQKFVVDEMQRWGKVVKENGIKAD